MADDLDFEKLIADNNHAELVGLLKKLILVTDKSDKKEDKSVSDAINKNNEEIKNIVAKVSALVDKEVKEPTVNINTDTKPLVAALNDFNKTASGLIGGQEEIMKLLKIRATRMDIKRDYGNLTHVEIKYDKIQ